MYFLFYAITVIVLALIEALFGIATGRLPLRSQRSLASGEDHPKVIDEQVGVVGPDLKLVDAPVLEAFLVVR